MPTLSLSEARLVINKVLDIRRNAEGEGGRPVTEEPEYVIYFYLRMGGKRPGNHMANLDVRCH